MCLPIEANGNELHYMSTASELLPQINSVLFSNARVEMKWRPVFLSLGAHSASQLSTWNIWTTRQISSACAFDKVHQGAIRVCLSDRDELRVSINTDGFFLVFVGVVRSHQIPMILLGPSRWTVIPSGHHQRWATWVDIADGALGALWSWRFLSKGLNDSSYSVPYTNPPYWTPSLYWSYFGVFGRQR